MLATNLILATVGLPSLLASPAPVTPGAAWATVTPTEVQLDAARLAAFAKYVGGRGCVVRHGYLAYTWGDAARRGDVASAAKPVYTYFLLKALEDGRIPSLDQRVAELVPGLADLNPDLNHKDREITWRHMANQTSCYGVREAPGTAFCYNDWQMALFWDTLFQRVYGATYRTVDEQVLRPLLAGPLGCEDEPTLLAFGANDRPGRLAISPRDFARFGLLYLRRGRWGKKQLLTERLAVMAVANPLPNDIPRSAGEAAAMLAGQRTIGSRRVPDNQADHLGSYSFAWWLNGLDRDGHRHWPDAPEDTYGCFGHGGKRAMVVLPSLDLVVSWNDTRVVGREMGNEALGRLVAAVGVGGAREEP